MKEGEIRDLIEKLKEKFDIEEAEFTLAGNTRYEIKDGNNALIFDRRNNCDTGKSECYMKVGDFKKVFREGTTEYDLISEFISSL